MNQGRRQRILAVNVGSSSLKVSLYRPDGEDGEWRELTATGEKIGRADSRVVITAADGTSLLDRTGTLPDHRSALAAILGEIQMSGHGDGLLAIGHRIVHGGRSYIQPQLITDDLVAHLRDLIPLDPDHLPQSIDVIDATRERLSDHPQIACFDTAFHHTMPAVARRYPLPRTYEDQGVIRYGFHGLSYEAIVQELRRRGPLAHRLIVAHLGSGASLAAIRDGVSIETTMGFTPTGGLMMGTRTGDLDPGVLLYLLRQDRMDPHALSDLVNHEAGLLGVSGRSSDIRDLLDRSRDDASAAAAIELFCYSVRKALGGLVVVLGGLDEVVFTGGIGEHAAPVREGICAGLEFLGLQIDPGRNTTGAPTISPDSAPVPIRVIPSDENRTIARHTRRIVQGGVSDVPV